MSHNQDSIVGFKHRLANYFERMTGGEVHHLRHLLETLPKAFTTPEAQDTLMRFVSDRCGIEEAEAVEELDYVTARLERDRRNERFERLLEPWSSEQLEASLTDFFSAHDASQLPTVSALVTFYRGKEITLIRELELQYRRPVLLTREEDDDTREEASAMELAEQGPGGGDQDTDGAGGNNALSGGGGGGGGAGGSGGGGDAAGGGAGGEEEADDHDVRADAPSSGAAKKKDGGGGGGTDGDDPSGSGKDGGAGGSGGKKKLTRAKSSAASYINKNLRNSEEITVDMMQSFEMDILRFLLDIRTELQQRVQQATELQASKMAPSTSAVLAAASTNKKASSSSSSSSSKDKDKNKDKDKKKKDAVDDAGDKSTADAAATTKNDVASSITELSHELAALPRKRLARVERMLQYVPLMARAITPIFKSQLLNYLGFFCSLRVEARKVMQKRLAGTFHGDGAGGGAGGGKADENFGRRVQSLLGAEYDARRELQIEEKRTWLQLDPLFFRERHQRLTLMLLDNEASKRDDIEFDELCVSSVARAKMRSLVFLERCEKDLNSVETW